MVAVTVAIFSLIVSSVTAWLTLFRRGTVRMTQPTVIFFGPESSMVRGGPLPKVYLRTLLFATSKRGRVIESAYVVVARDGARHSFNVWVYGERNQLVRGSGLFVGETGLAANHHFLESRAASRYVFSEGTYRLDVFVHLLGDRSAKALFSQELAISADAAPSLAEGDTGIYFDWEPDGARYTSHVDRWEPPAEPSV